MINGSLTSWSLWLNVFSLLCACPFFLSQWFISTFPAGIYKLTGREYFLRVKILFVCAKKKKIPVSKVTRRLILLMFVAARMLQLLKQVRDEAAPHAHHIWLQVRAHTRDWRHRTGGGGLWRLVHVTHETYTTDQALLPVWRKITRTKARVRGSTLTWNPLYWNKRPLPPPSICPYWGGWGGFSLQITSLTKPTYSSGFILQPTHALQVRSPALISPFMSY